MTFKQESCVIKAVYEFKNADFHIRFQIITNKTQTKLRWLEIKHDKSTFTYKPDENVKNLPKDAKTFAFAYARVTDSGKVLTSTWPLIYNAIQNASKKLEKPTPSNDYVSGAIAPADKQN